MSSLVRAFEQQVELRLRGLQARPAPGLAAPRRCCCRCSSASSSFVTAIPNFEVELQDLTGDLRHDGYLIYRYDLCGVAADDCRLTVRQQGGVYIRCLRRSTDSVCSHRTLRAPTRGGFRRRLVRFQSYGCSRLLFHGRTNTRQEQRHAQDRKSRTVRNRWCPSRKMWDFRVATFDCHGLSAFLTCGGAYAHADDGDISVEMVANCDSDQTVRLTAVLVGAYGIGI